MRMYRRMLKTMMKTFNGDPEMFHRVRLEVRKKTYEHSELRDPVEI
jgi:complex III assembly factor LYRM7